jgi:7,8-dihydroneopterin 2',3'-cyclic phosphate phosphodiesterase
MMAKYSMKDALELANQIKDKKLREKVIKMLKEPSLSDPELVYPTAPFDKIPAWTVGAHHGYDGGELDHTISTTKLALSMAEHFVSVYGVKINMDHIIAGALLHDIAKVWIIKKEGKSWGFTGINMDHADLGAAELYARGFPEEVVHIVASHGGDVGQSGANPRTLEAMLVFKADVLDAETESHIRPSASQLPFQLLLLGGDKNE